MPACRLLSLLFACVLVMGTASAADDLGRILERALQGSHTPAVAGALLLDGHLAEQAVRGARRNDAGEQARLDDVWLLGSTSKVISVAAIARLVEQGVLDWSTPLVASLPELAERMHPDYRRQTLVELLSHRSGLPENLRDLRRIDAYFSDARPLPEQRLEYAALALQEAPEVAPGSAFVYSNTGFIVAAVIAERATGKAFEAVVREQVFEPLGMRSAGFGATAPGQPQGHRGGRPAEVPRSAEAGVPPMFGPAGYMHMSLADWATFCMDQLAGARGAGVLLQPASYRLMQDARPGSPAGLDWGVAPAIAGRQGPVLMHGGSDGNWLAYAVLFPRSGNAALVVANAAGDMDADRVTRAVLAELFPQLAPAVAAD